MQPNDTGPLPANEEGREASMKLPAATGVLAKACLLPIAAAMVALLGFASSEFRKVPIRQTFMAFVVGGFPALLAICMIDRRGAIRLIGLCLAHIGIIEIAEIAACLPVGRLLFRIMPNSEIILVPILWLLPGALAVLWLLGSMRPLFLSIPQPAREAMHCVWAALMYAISLAGLLFAFLSTQQEVMMADGDFNDPLFACGLIAIGAVWIVCSLAPRRSRY